MDFSYSVMFTGPLLALFLVVRFSAGEDPPLVETKLGKISGSWDVSRSGRKFAIFNAIPFAQPPIGQLRFQAPKPVSDEWGGVLNATGEMPVCTQPDSTDFMEETTTLTGSEDCLYLSVFTHNITGKAPVLAYIHGGAFVIGNPGWNGPNYVMDEDIVVVMISYRLGVIGFLSLEDEVLPGNQGMKDQVLALRWVQENIYKFGGDPDRVTIIGESAGGASVFHHTISPLSKGLFQQAIAESGTSYAVWAVQPPESAKRATLELLTSLNCSGTQKEAMQCALNKTAKELLTTPYKSKGIIGPVFERAGPGAFLVAPISKWVHSPVPLLMGVTSAEGLLVTYRFGLSQDLFKKFSDNIDKLLPLLLGYDRSSSKPAQVTQALRQYYLPNRNITMDDWVNITTIFSDALFVIPGLEGADNHKGDVFFYYFDYKHREQSPFLDEKLIFGAFHCLESNFIWKTTDRNTQKEKITSDEDVMMSKKLVNIIGNFVKYGNPTPEGSSWKWNKWTEKKHTYIYINQSGFQEQEALAADRYRFWKDLIPTYRDNYDKGTKNSGSFHITSTIIFVFAIPLLFSSHCYLNFTLA